jgi:hypothetical protein
VPIFFFLFWLMVVGFLASGLLISALGWLFARKRKVPVLMWVCGMVFVGFSAATITGVTIWGVAMWRSSQPDLVFANVFHEKPPAGTTMMHGHSGGFADSAGVSLAFRTDRATFDRLRPAGLERVTLERYRSFLTTRPSWWRQPDEKTEIWLLDDASDATRSQRQFMTEWTFMTWDPDGLVQYDWTGID